MRRSRRTNRPPGRNRPHPHRSSRHQPPRRRPRQHRKRRLHPRREPCQRRKTHLNPTQLRRPSRRPRLRKQNRRPNRKHPLRRRRSKPGPRRNPRRNRSPSLLRSRWWRLHRHRQASWTRSWARSRAAWRAIAGSSRQRCWWRATARPTRRRSGSWANYFSPFALSLSKGCSFSSQRKDGASTSSARTGLFYAKYGEGALAPAPPSPDRGRQQQPARFLAHGEFARLDLAAEIAQRLRQQFADRQRRHAHGIDGEEQEARFRVEQLAAIGAQAGQPFLQPPYLALRPAAEFGRVGLYAVV